MLFGALLLLPAVPQDATVSRPSQGADGTQRWSILAKPCAADRRDGADVVVCGVPADQAQRLPLPGERGPPDRAMPSNPEVSGTGALAADFTPCAARTGGCQSGMDILGGGTALIRLVGKAIDSDSCCEEPGEGTSPVKLVGDMGSAVGRIFKKKPDKSKRVPILLDDLPPSQAAVPAP